MKDINSSYFKRIRMYIMDIANILKIDGNVFEPYSDYVNTSNDNKEVLEDDTIFNFNSLKESSECSKLVKSKKIINFSDYKNK